MRPPALKSVVAMLGLLAGSPTLAGPAPEPGSHGHYLVLTGKTHTPPPFASADVVYGPREEVGPDVWLWWELSARTEASHEAPPLFRLRCLTSRDPLAAETEGASRPPLEFRR